MLCNHKVAQTVEQPDLVVSLYQECCIAYLNNQECYQICNYFQNSLKIQSVKEDRKVLSAGINFFLYSGCL